MRTPWAWHTTFEIKFIISGNKEIFMSNFVSLTFVIAEISMFKQTDTVSGTAQSTCLVILIKNVYILLLHTFAPSSIPIFHYLQGVYKLSKDVIENGNSPQLFRALRRALSKHYPIIMAAALMISYSLFSLLLLLMVEHSTH